jgi:putative tryptophan/tyrosine transport system ATP-binding protein
MLEIRQVHKTFNAGTPNEVRALRGVNLTIDEGSFVIVIGTNGSGKSTTLNAVAGGFIVDSGTISINGTDVTAWPEHRRAAFIGRVFQNPFSGTAPTMTIAENLALAARRGRPRGLGWALKRSALDDFRDRIRRLNMGLEDRLENPIGSLSGGQRQAITLVMASWIRPKVLLLDEHTAALDPKSADQVIRLSEEIVTRDKLTTVMVTHSMSQALQFGDRTVMLHRGKIVFDVDGEQRAALTVADLLRLFRRDQGEELADDALLLG